jgi:hypothetical protein
MSNKDLIPEKDRELLQWTNNLLTQLAGMIDRIGFPEHEYQTLTELRDDYSAKLILAEETVTRTKVTVQDKNDARKILKAMLRQDIKEYLNYNRALSDSDRDTLGLPVYKKGRTLSAVARTHPDYDVDSHEIRCLRINFFEHDNRHSRAKPAGQLGVEVRWGIFDVPPRSIDDLTHSNLVTRTPFTLAFDEYQRGKTVYFCLCWQNTRGEKGPWSEIVGAIIS